jgi:hypothetical protein
MNERSKERTLNLSLTFIPCELFLNPANARTKRREKISIIVIIKSGCLGRATCLWGLAEGKHRSLFEGSKSGHVRLPYAIKKMSRTFLVRVLGSRKFSTRLGFHRNIYFHIKNSSSSYALTSPNSKVSNKNAKAGKIPSRMLLKVSAEKWTAERNKWKN